MEGESEEDVMADSDTSFLAEFVEWLIEWVLTSAMLYCVVALIGESWGFSRLSFFTCLGIVYVVPKLVGRT